MSSLKSFHLFFIFFKLKTTFKNYLWTATYLKNEGPCISVATHQLIVGCGWMRIGNSSYRHNGHPYRWIIFFYSSSKLLPFWSWTSVDQLSMVWIITHKLQLTEFMDGLGHQLAPKVGHLLNCINIFLPSLNSLNSRHMLSFISPTTDTVTF